MARHYSTKDFFRQMPNALLARYFQAMGLFGDMDFAAMKRHLASCRANLEAHCCVYVCVNAC